MTIILKLYSLSLCQHFGIVAEEVEAYLGLTYLTFPYDISLFGELLEWFTWRLHPQTPLKTVPKVLILSSKVMSHIEASDPENNMMIKMMIEMSKPIKAYTIWF